MSPCLRKKCFDFGDANNESNYFWFLEFEFVP